MHLNHDLVAQYHLKILREYSADYVPALVNLTVVEERLHRFSQAQELAAKGAPHVADVGAAAFNLAWYRDLAGDHEAPESC